jgi:hypothetical protein
MHDGSKPKPSWSKWILIGAGWTLFAFFFASEVVVRMAYAGQTDSFCRRFGSLADLRGGFR